MVTPTSDLKQGPNPAESPPPGPPSRKLLSFGTATIGLATVAELVGNIQKIQHGVTDMIGLSAFKNVNRVMMVIVATALILGYGVAIYWIYMTLRRHSIGTRIAMASLATVLMVGLAAGSYALMPSSANAETYQASKVKEWVDRLLERPTESGGVPTSFSDPQARPQVWTTAQALRAVLVSGVDLKPLAAKIRNAFDYIENGRIKTAPGGWGYFEEWQTGVTEIAGWVCVAETASLDPKQRDIVWPRERMPEIVERSNRVVQLLISSQQDDGGWGPTADKNSPGLSRTYSTTLATWCLIDAHGSEAIPSLLDERYDRAINKGLTWLLQSYQPGLGWVPNPTRKNQNETFLGLNAQVLYVLARAQAMPHFSSVATLPNAALAKTQFLTFPDFPQRRLGDNNRLHDGDRYMPRALPVAPAPVTCACPPFTIESSTFLWYPWSLAAARALAADQTVPKEQRAKAVSLAETLTARLSEAKEPIDSGFNYVVAEFLIGASQHGPQRSRRSAN